MKTLKLAMIGYGNVGKAFADMLLRRTDFLREEFDTEVKIVAISRSKGALLCADGIDTVRLAKEAADETVEGVAPYEYDAAWTSMDVIDKYDYDVMIETTPINIKTGQPAADHIRHALERGKHAITANKGPIAWHYRELRDLAKEKGVVFCHESTVMDGIPIFNLKKETLMGCKVTEVKGILNATTNLILEQIAQGVTFEDAVAEGQRRGIVEADPTMDTDGWDASAKLTALMNVLMDEKITPMDIDRTGISNVTKADIDAAAAEGKVIKLLCHGRIVDGKPVGKVAPTLISKDELLASINGTAACVEITTDLAGPISIIEHAWAPEIDQTAFGVFSDMCRILTETR